MSKENVSLEFPGEQMLRVQADLRGIWSEQILVESEQSNTRAGLAVVRSDIKRSESKLDNLAGSVDARFEQVNQTMATNLDLMLKAFESVKR